MARAITTSRVEMLGVLPEAELVREIRLASLGIVTQRPDVAEFNLPSKLMNYFAAGLPVLASVRPESETARIVERSQGGWVTDAASPRSFAAKANELLRNPVRLLAAGVRGRRYAELNFAADCVVDRIEGELREAFRVGRPPIRRGVATRGARWARPPARAEVGAPAGRTVVRVVAPASHDVGRARSRTARRQRCGLNVNRWLHSRLRLALTRASKLGRLAQKPGYWPALRRGVAASVEHHAVPFRDDIRTVLDVGASRGQFALFAIERFPGARVICFEPLPESRVALDAVLRGRVHVHPFAVGAGSGAATLHVSGHDDSSSFLPIGRRQVDEFRVPRRPEPSRLPSSRLPTI